MSFPVPLTIREKEYMEEDVASGLVPVEPLPGMISPTAHLVNDFASTISGTRDRSSPVSFNGDAFNSGKESAANTVEGDVEDDPTLSFFDGGGGDVPYSPFASGGLRSPETPSPTRFAATLSRGAGAGAGSSSSARVGAIASVRTRQARVQEQELEQEQEQQV